MDNMEINVFSTGMLDEEFANKFSKQWLVELPDGRIEEYDTEKEACDRQLDLIKQYKTDNPF